MDYSEKARKARGILGMTQSQLAEHLGVSRGHVANVEQGIKQYGRNLEATLINDAGLPPGFFSDGVVPINPTDDEFYAMLPEAKAAGMTKEQVKDLLKVIARGKILD